MVHTVSLWGLQVKNIQFEVGAVAQDTGYWVCHASTRAAALQHEKMPSFYVRDCGWWYRAVESHESAAFFYSQAEQVDIGKIPRCEYSSRLETTRIAQGDGIWPEDVIPCGNCPRKPAHNFRDGQVARIV